MTWTLEQADPSAGVALVDDVGWTAIWTTIGGLIGGFFMWLTQGRKGKAEVEVAAIGEWQKLYNALSSRVSELEQARARDREDHAREMAQLISDHSEAMEALKANHRAEMQELRNYCTGLEATIRQNSQSTAHLLGKIPKDSPDGK